MVNTSVKVFEQPASYIIGKNDTTYYAIKCSDGSITTNSSAHTLINSVILFGGTIILKRGTYELTDSIVIPYTANCNGLSLIGESYEYSMGTYLKFSSSGTNKTMITVGEGTESKLRGVTIKNLYLDGEASTGNGIDFVAWESLIENCEISDFVGIGIKVIGDPNNVIQCNRIHDVNYGIYIDSTAPDNQIFENIINQCQYCGIWVNSFANQISGNLLYSTALDASGNYYAIEVRNAYRTTITNNRIDDKYGIHIYGLSGVGSGYNIISNNKIYLTDGGTGIKLQGNTGIVCKSNLVTSNMIIPVSTTPLYGIREVTGDVNYNQIMTNYIVNSASFTGAVIVKLGANTIIKDNNGFLTESSGDGTITAGNTYVEITHGLAVTPDIDKIRIYAQDNLYNRTLWVSDVGATTFRINISSVDIGDHIVGWEYKN